VIFSRSFAVSAGAALAGGLALASCTAYEPHPVCDFSAYESFGFGDPPPPTGPALVAPVAGALQPMPLDTVNVTDQGILRKVLVQSVAARRTETQTVQVAAKLVNCTDHALQVEGRTHFYDAGQAESEPVSAWQRLMLSPRTVTTYSERSTGTDQVTSYLVELREGR
jgi:hypothetical protein